jgi:hypothetical protein
MKFLDDEFVKIVEPEPTLPKDIDALRLLQMVYRGEFKATPQQMRAVIEALPYETPKLTAMAIGTLNDQNFYARLERAIERSERARLIEGTIVNDD